MNFIKIAFAALCAASVSVAGQAADNEGFITKSSRYSVDETLDRLEAVLKSKGLTIFARIDHAAGAEKANLKLPATQLLIFGNPKAGTPLMASNRLVGIDLPLKALAWADEAGKVWLAYPSMEAIKQRHGITDRDVVFTKIAGALDKLTDAALKAE